MKGGIIYGDVIRAVIKESAQEIQISKEKAWALLERIISKQRRITFNGSVKDGESTDSSTG